jgi:predicted transcriptional regulator
LGELSNELKEFIAGHVHSVIRLEVLLLLSQDPDQVWKTDAVARKLNLTSSSAKAHLNELLSQGLLMLVGEERYRYQPASDEVTQMIRQLSKAYAKQRIAVLTMILSNPVDKVHRFTETFRMIKGESESAD